MKKPTIGIIGTGNMGGAIFRRLKTSGFAVYATDRSPTKVRALAPGAFLPLKGLCQKSNVLIIAIKPQSFDALALELKERKANKLIISIMAGITIKKISQLLLTKKIIRSMPNLPATLGVGLTGWVAAPHVTNTEKKLGEKILKTLGHTIELPTEKMINALTALSGSGPAYYFYLTTLIETAAKNFGFSPKAAALIATTTFTGAAALIQTGARPAALWQKAVASKGGTTEAALTTLKKNKFDKIFFKAIAAAKNRSQKLAK